MDSLTSLSSGAKRDAVAELEEYLSRGEALDVLALRYAKEVNRLRNGIAHAIALCEDYRLDPPGYSMTNALVSWLKYTEVWADSPEFERH